MDKESTDHAGALVGWASHAFGKNLVLDLQTYESQGWQGGQTPRRTSVMMTRNQATVLANDLLQATGNLPPARRRGWRRILFG